jgi:exosortase
VAVGSETGRGSFAAPAAQAKPAVESAFAPTPAEAPHPGMSTASWIATGLAFVVLFWVPLANTVDSWLNDPEFGHGLLLGPIAVYLAWKTGVKAGSRGQPWLGLALLGVAVLARYLAGLATGYFVMRLSFLVGLVGLAVFLWGGRQVLRWWLPFGLIALSLPLPDVIMTRLALPLQMQASQMGAALLDWRDVPVLLNGNVIHLPGHQLFVTEACSGLRSLSALLSLGLLIGGLWLRSPALRVLLFLTSVPIAIVLNGVRVFLTGFFVFFIDPSIGEGIMHYTEGWVIFVVAMVMQGALAWLLLRLESLTPSKVAP